MTVAPFSLSARAVAGVPAHAANGGAIVATAAGVAAEHVEGPASATMLRAACIEALTLPFVDGLLRLAPGVSVTQPGSRDIRAQQLRICAAKPEHALLFVGWEENAIEADHQDAVGYATAGRTVHAGLRSRIGA